MEAAAPSAKRLEPGRILSEAFSSYRDNPGPLLGSAFVVFAILGIVSQLLLETDFGMWGVLNLLDLIGQGSPLIAFTFLYTLGTALGFVLLIVPGLILMTIWSLGPPAIVVEGIGPIRAFRRSQDLVEGVGWPVFIVVFVTSAIVVGVALALGALGATISEGVAAGYVSYVIASSLAAPIAALALATMYFQLSAGREAAGTADAQPPATPAA